MVFAIWLVPARKSLLYRLSMEIIQSDPDVFIGCAQAGFGFLLLGRLDALRPVFFKFTVGPLAGPGSLLTFNYIVGFSMTVVVCLSFCPPRGHDVTALGTLRSYRKLRFCKFRWCARTSRWTVLPRFQLRYPCSGSGMAGHGSHH